MASVFNSVPTDRDGIVKKGYLWMRITSKRVGVILRLACLGHGFKQNAKHFQLVSDLTQAPWPVFRDLSIWQNHKPFSSARLARFKASSTTKLQELKSDIAWSAP